MRLRELELVRYGGLAGQGLDFGDGRVDLHLIVGRNEAGKSTMLSAIGDLLFGFPGQTTQDWRFDQRELRIRAVVEQAGRAVAVVRRKGNKNTLLGPDGAALADDTLAALMGGIDRQAFERMFGLDHAKLRAGGQAILEGRDDAARAIFEAGTGLAAVGGALKALEARSAALFQPRGQKPEVNALLRERADALKRVRETSLGEADWTRIQDDLARAKQQREALIARGEALTARANAIERAERTRAPLARLAAARRRRAELGPLPRLPADAERTLAGARAERATARELRATHQDKLDAASRGIAAITLPEAILAARTRIETLDERRPAIEKALADLPRRVAELERIDASLGTARADAGLPPGAPLPSASWRKRARDWLERRRALEAGAARHAGDHLGHQREGERLAAALDERPEPTGLSDLRTALAAIPPDRTRRLAASADQAERASRRAANALAALGWTDTPEALARTALPSPAEVAEHGRRIDAAREVLGKARDDGEAARTEAIRQGELIDRLELAGGAPLATREAIDGARGARDAALADVRARLDGPRQADDAAAGLRLAEAVSQADALADRRDADSRRLAEYALAVAALNAARAAAAAADQLAARWAEALADAEGVWARTAAAAGLPDTLLPSGMEAWRAGRDRALEDHESAIAAASDHRRALEEAEAADARLARALTGAGLAAPDGEAETSADDRLDAAKAHAERLDKVAGDRAALLARLSAHETRGEALAREAEAIGRQRGALAPELARLAAETGVAHGDAAALEEALAAIDAVTAEAGARGGVRRQVDAIEGDLAAFNADVAGLLADLARPPAPRAVDSVRGLAAELKAALTLEAELARLNADVEAARAGIRAVDRRLAAADEGIAALMRAAGVDAEPALDAVIAAGVQAAAAAAAEDQALGELADLGEGHEVAALAAAAEALPPDAAAAERETVAAQRREIAASREAVGRALAEAQARAAHAASAADAADAQQQAAEARTALTASAERYIESAAAAALLRWLIERHRANTQAPLLVRAGALFARVTGGAFGGLTLDYGDDDRPRIVAARPDGTRLGVEGLSEGTRDQLFLALRLGSLQARPGGAPAPLVCDDLLITSDDTRAGAILDVLKAASGTMQVLIFTHHDHIEGVARRAIGEDGFRLHRLPPLA